MSATQNLIYAVVQVAHNFGAVAVVGGSVGAAGSRNPSTQNNLAWLAFGGWCVQALSGATFGAVTYYHYHQLPDIPGVATVALITKMGCVACGILLLAAYLYRGADWLEKKRQAVWYASSALAVTALSAAAFLRWFS